MKTALLIFALVITILGASTHLYLFTPSAYHSLTDEYSTSPEARTFSSSTIQFLLGEDHALDELNTRELSHMHDVRTLIRILFFIYVVSLFFVLGNVTAPQLPKALLIASAFVLIACIGATTLPFPLLFDRFHQLLFAPGTWLFPLESPLIRTFPAPFFLAFFTRILITAVAISSIILAVTGAARLASRCSTTTNLK